MLNNLLSTVFPGDDDARDGMHQSSQHSTTKQETAYNMTDDEMADFLLTQFPSYGTNPNILPVLVDDDDDDDETKNDGIGIPSTTLRFAWRNPNTTTTDNNARLSSLSSSDHQVVVEEPTATQPLPSNLIDPEETKSAAANDDWDYDEQNLWHTTTTSPSTPKNKKKRKSKRGYEWNNLPHQEWINGEVADGGGTKSPPPPDASMSPTIVPSSPRSLTSLLLSPQSNHQNNNNDNNNSNHSSAATPATRRLERRFSSSSFLSPSKQQQQQQDVSRQHWMPDKLCKQCYACDTPFTVFRRRHHCRFCGQVFCSNCSAYFVELPGAEATTDSNAFVAADDSMATTTTTTTTMRACGMCFENMQQQQQQPPPHGHHKRIDSTASAASASSATQQHHTGTAASQEQQPQRKDVSHKTILDNPQVVLVVQSPSQQQQRLEQQIHAGDDSVLNQLSAKRERERQRQQLEEQQPQEPQTAAASTTPDILDKDLLYSNHNNRASSKKATTIIEAEATAALAANKKQLLQTQTSSVDSANRHLGMTAANHLEQLGKNLLQTDAPLLWEEECSSTKQQWINTLMTLATRCCATVEPNVKKGDLLDIRPYCKIKTIPGGSVQDCAYMSGVVFRKNVSHKRMAKELSSYPRIMLLSGGIEFTRAENQIASLDTLLEQEETYMEILVGKILKLKPDILLVGRSVSRKAQELLLRNQVILIQHVKSTLLTRISRQTGATIISSTDHVMNKFDESVLGKCRRFRLVTFRDNEAWVDQKQDGPETRALIVRNESDTVPANKNAGPAQNAPPPRSIPSLLEDETLSNHERQAALAANMLGETVLDGSEAVKKGLAKRGVAQTYIMLEGCPKHLGCTVILRGASRVALKQVKRVFRFLVNVAYNLKLEMSYLRERCAKLPDSFEEGPEQLISSSLCVDYGGPPQGRKVRPWNGRNSETVQRSISGEVTAFDQQSILITSVWMTEQTQCCPAEVKGICYYSLQDVSLGQFLRDSCFNLSLKCQNSTCKKSVLDHALTFIHNDGLINITVEHMEDPLPPSPLENSGNSEHSRDDDSSYDPDDTEVDSPIATWTYCVNCAKVVTPLVYISEDTWKYSFGKFLESVFYNRDATMNSPEHGCSCQMQSAATLYFGCGRLAARFTYEKVRPYGVYVRRSLPIDENFHRMDALGHLGQISVSANELFVNFDKHIGRVSMEARSLFGSAANRPEHLQTVLSELSSIGSEVDHAAKTLQEKIASVSDKCRESMGQLDGGGRVVNESLFRFPWYCRRYLFVLTSAWNERLSTAGQAITAMKKLASSSQTVDLLMNPNPVPSMGDGSADELMDSMKRLRQLHEVYSQYNVSDITTVLPTGPGLEVPNRDMAYDDDFDGAEGAIDFADGVDADVLASRRRLYNSKPMNSLDSRSNRGSEAASRRPRKSLGTPARQRQSSSQQESIRPSSNAPHSRGARDPSPTPGNQNSQSLAKNKTVTPGGAVKSAINRFFNRGGKELDPYVVDLGIFAEGRPRLEVGVGGIVVPVMDDQPSTVIAYSLSSAEYHHQFKQFSKADGTTPVEEPGEDLGPDAPIPHPRSRNNRNQNRPSNSSPSPSISSSGDERKDIERRMLFRNKSHIKHTFRDFDEKGQQTCKFVCTAYWATQFHAVRQAFLTPREHSSSPPNGSQPNLDVEKSYVQSLSSAFSWAASGGKSGASFARTSDERFVIKCISRTELQMFLDCAPAYFEYLSKAFFHGLPTVLCKIVGVYQIGYHDRVTGKRSMEQVAVMQNIFYGRKISKIFDLKGSLRGRFAKDKAAAAADSAPILPEAARNGSDSELSSSKHNHGGGGDDGNNVPLSFDSKEQQDEEDNTNAFAIAQGSSVDQGAVMSATLLDGDFLEFTNGRPLPLTDRAKAVFHMSVLNDSLFLSIINVLDYSILVGIDEERMELVVGIIDFMRQYDILKQMERVGKSLPMVVGSEAPTIIQPPLYKARFTNAMERYFMTVPNKWTII